MIWPVNSSKCLCRTTMNKKAIEKWKYADSVDENEKRLDIWILIFIRSPGSNICCLHLVCQKTTPPSRKEEGGWFDHMSGSGRRMFAFFMPRPSLSLRLAFACRTSEGAKGCLDRWWGAKETRCWHLTFSKPTSHLACRQPPPMCVLD